MGMLWAYLGPLLYISLLTGVLIYLFKKRFTFQFLLPLAIISATLFVYFFTFVFHHITAGIVITVVAALAFVPLLILDKNRQDTLVRLFFTPGFLIFVLLYTFLFVFHYNTIPQMFSDDTMHWAPHVWTMWLRDDFYTSPGVSIVTHGDYQPILQLFQLIVTKVAGMYREGLLYVALEITCLAMLFPVLKDLVWKKGRVIKTLLISAFILLSLMAIPVSLDVTHLFYNALHPDYAIAFVFVLGVFLAVTESRKFSWFSVILLSLVITFLCLTKQSSVLFGGLIGLIYFAGLYHSYRPNNKAMIRKLLKYLKDWRKNWRYLLLSAVLLLLPLIGLKLWQSQIKGFESPYCCVAIFGISASDALKVPGVLLGETGNESQQTYARKFFQYIVTYQVGFTTHILASVTYMQFILLFIAAMVYVGYNYKDKFRRSKLVITVTILVAGWFVYCFAIYLTFLFGGMIDSERDNLLTGDRYLRTYIFALLLTMFIMAIGFAIEKFNEKKYTNKSLTVFCIVLFGSIGLLLNVDIIKSGYVFESKRFDREYASAGIDNVSELSSSMRAFTRSIGGSFENPKKIAVTVQNGANSSYYLRYLAIPNRIDNGSDIMFDKKMTQDKLCDTLRSNDFLFINHVYEDKKYTDMINDCLTERVESFELFKAYKIEKDSDSLRLVEWKF